MHALVRRRAFSQLNPVVFRKLSTYGPKATSVLVSTPKNHPYHENIRSSCAPPFSSTAPPGSSRTADVTDLRPVFSEITLDIEQIVNKIGVQEMNERFNKNYPPVLRKVPTYGTKIRTNLFLEPVTTFANPENHAREYSTRKLLPFKEIYKSNCVAFSSASTSNFITNNDVPDLKNIYPEVIRDLTQKANQDGLSEVMERFILAMDYNVFSGKENYLLMSVATYKGFAAPEQLIKENLRKAQILGWCCRMALASILMTDDIMDGCKMRHAKPCWYRMEDVGMTAINDAAIIEYATFALLHRHFHKDPLYYTYVELFQNMFFNTYLGQCFDLQCVKGGKPQLYLFTSARYAAIVKHKTAIALHLPVALGILLTHGNHPEMHTHAKAIMIEMSNWYQAQDDFLDYIGTLEKNGKDIALDIQDGKCTWLAVTALERASREQRDIMERCYGSPRPEDIQAVRDVYTQLHITDLYWVYEKEVLSRIRAQIAQHFGENPQNMFNEMIAKLKNV